VMLGPLDEERGEEANAKPPEAEARLPGDERGAAALQLDRHIGLRVTNHLRERQPADRAGIPVLNALRSLDPEARRLHPGSCRSTPHRTERHSRRNRPRSHPAGQTPQAQEQAPQRTSPTGPSSANLSFPSVPSASFERPSQSGTRPTRRQARRRKACASEGRTAGHRAARHSHHASETGLTKRMVTLRLRDSRVRKV
jgi:hypothetical protein